LPFDFPTKIVFEGEAKLLIPKIDKSKTLVKQVIPSKTPVFYNPIMNLNRDFAVIALQCYQKKENKKLKAAETFAGCGVRGIRFAKEVKGLSEIHLNDLNFNAYELTKHNIDLNGVSDFVYVANRDANFFLNLHAAPKTRFNYIDIDPFGSPVSYLDTTVRALVNGGLLGVTATDLAPLCGVHPKAALRKYGGISLRTEYCHELALRLLLRSLIFTASKHNRGIEVLFSYSSEHYIRIYVIIKGELKIADKNIRKIGFISHCFSCLHREISIGIASKVSDKCKHCGSNMKKAGPLWLGELSNKKFCEQMNNEAYKTKSKRKYRIHKMLELIGKESDAPQTYFVIDKICKKIKNPVPSVKNVVEELKKRGYKVTLTHFHTRGVKTDASIKTIAEIIRKITK
jgi:tRNA (guanine26-N2/guanine27-N2)-dimethyltransferase